jgi:hypothetical protein
MSKAFDKKVEALIVNASETKKWYKELEKSVATMRKERYIIGGIVSKAMDKGQTKELKDSLAKTLSLSPKYIYHLANSYRKFVKNDAGATLAMELGLGCAQYMDNYAKGDPIKWQEAIDIYRKHGSQKGKEMLRAGKQDTAVVFMRFAMTPADREFVIATLDNLGAVANRHQGDRLIALCNDHWGNNGT